MKKDCRELPDNEYNVLFELILLPMIRESSADSDLTCYREINEVDLAKSLSVPERKVTEAFEQLLLKGLITVELDTKPRKKIEITHEGYNILTDHMIDYAIGVVIEPELRSRITEIASKRGVQFDDACMKLLKAGVKSMETNTAIAGEERALDRLFGNDDNSPGH